MSRFLVQLGAFDIEKEEAPTPLAAVRWLAKFLSTLDFDTLVYEVDDLEKDDRRTIDLGETFGCTVEDRVHVCPNCDDVWVHAIPDGDECGCTTIDEQVCEACEKIEEDAS